eukprot:m.43629 g.43629  ORF g.43629 m.43629 type:complete len:183 (+) comp12242_c0_seq1:132-680(+)
MGRPGQEPAAAAAAGAASGDAPAESKSAKIKIKKVVHPKSREAKRMQKKAHRKEKMHKLKVTTNNRLASKGHKLVWFRSRLVPGKPSYTDQEICTLIRAYINRHESELHDIQELQQQKGVEKNAGRAEALTTLKRQEQEQFKSGFEAPDLRRLDTVERLTNWTGELKDLPAIQMAHFKDPLA